MDLLNKIMNFIRRLNRADVYFLTRLQIWWLISGMEVVIKYKISAQYLSNYAC